MQQNVTEHDFTREFLFDYHQLLPDLVLFIIRVVGLVFIY